MSPRSKKPRRCGCRLKGKAFKPAGVPMEDLGQVVFYKDELESIRLCDFKGLTQAEAALRMGVSRSTVQRILRSARMKTATALSECRAIVFDPSVCERKAGPRNKRKEKQG